MSVGAVRRIVVDAVVDVDVESCFASAVNDVGVCLKFLRNHRGGSGVVEDDRSMVIDGKPGSRKLAGFDPCSEGLNPPGFTVIVRTGASGDESEAVVQRSQGPE